jgi:hypothetical protein
MITIGNFQANQPDPWRIEIDRFVTLNELELAALAWGLSQNKQEGQDLLGIDLRPTPHFVYCSKEALETLNRNVKGHIQEILGLVEGHDPAQEVLILTIGEGQVKLIHYQPDPLPPACFDQVGEETIALLEKLEQRLVQHMQL